MENTDIDTEIKNGKLKSEEKSLVVRKRFNVFERISTFVKQVKSSVQGAIQERKKIKANKAQNKEDIMAARSDNKQILEESKANMDKWREDQIAEINRIYQQSMEYYQEQYDNTEQEINENNNKSAEKSEGIKTEHAKGQAENLRDYLRNMNNFASVDPMPRNSNTTEEQTKVNETQQENDDYDVLTF